jgi:hypothetical protein
MPRTITFNQLRAIKAQLPEGSYSRNERVDREILEHTYDGNFLDPVPFQFQMFSYSLATSSE